MNSGSASSNQNYTDLSLSNLSNSWNNQPQGGASGQNYSGGGLSGGLQRGIDANTPSISLSAAPANISAVTGSNPGGGGGLTPNTQHHSVPQFSITRSISSPNHLSNSASNVPDCAWVKAEPLSPRDHQHSGIQGLSYVQQLHPLQHPAHLQRPHSANSALSSHSHSHLSPTQ